MFQLQDKIKINNIEYPINTDYRAWLKFQNLIKDLKEDEESFVKVLSFFVEIGLDFEINFFKEALEECVSFFVGKNSKNSTSSSSDNKKVFEFERDEKYIYSAFLQEYNIDLYTIENLHWHKFKSLLESLSEETQLSKIIQYRSVELSKIKDKEQKKYYKKMKEIYSLDIDEEKMSTEQYHNNIKLRLKKRFAEVEKMKKGGVKMNG